MKLTIVIAKVALFVSVLASMPVYAALTWHNGVTVASVDAWDDGSFILRFSASAPTCLNTNGYYYVKPNQNGVTEEGAKKIYAAALMAKAMGSSVNVNFDNATNGCFIKRLMLI